MTSTRITSDQTGGRQSDKTFSAEERAAMQERAAEAKTAARRGREQEKAADDERDVTAKIAAMSQPDRALAERVHAIVTAASPELLPKTWYGMPAYARNGKIVCFFQPAEKFKTRYATLGFSDEARLDDGTLWPVTYALTSATDSEADAITALVLRAVS